MKKVFKVIKKIILGILGVIFFGFAIIMTILLLGMNDYGVSQFGNTSLVIIPSDISSDNYTKGDLVVVESKKIGQLNVGDEIFTYKLDGSGAVYIQLGEIGEVHTDEDAVTFVNGDTYSMKFVAGIATDKYSNLGTYMSIIESKWGFLFIVLVPSFLMFVWEFYALVIEIKYGKEEDYVDVPVEVVKEKIAEIPVEKMEEALKEEEEKSLKEEEKE
ncbi:MAG: hypothetical protein PHD02_02065 [Bacilli bacterium]|nr:hypothetical protein [Bacilli bacterium]